MDSYKMPNEEKEYLSEYHIDAFERPSIATDIAIFSILNEGIQNNVRKLQKKALKLLLIKRGSYPYKDSWALPGGFCKPGEDVRETAKRELFEETNVENAYLQLVGVYGEKNRDPRGWIISNTFMALMDGKACQLRAETDVWEAGWFHVNVGQHEVKREIFEERIELETEYLLELVNEELGITLKAKVKEYKSFQNYHESVGYDILEPDCLAFDHARIILEALLMLRKNVENAPKRMFDLMPELFTLTQLQKAFETMLGEKQTAANFRRKIGKYVQETEQVVEGVGFRPARLFRRNMEEFCQ